MIARSSCPARIALGVTLAMSSVPPIRAGTTTWPTARTGSAPAWAKAIAHAGCRAIASHVDALPENHADRRHPDPELNLSALRLATQARKS